MRTSLVPALVLAAAALPAGAAQFTVTVTNLTQGLYFTPVLITAHGAGHDLFEVGHAASANLQAMAEGGDISGLVGDADAAGATSATDPAGGPLAPGASTSADLDTGATGNDHLSVVAMLLPTNDAFFGLDAAALPTAPGSHVYYVNAYDAGTEANDELITGGGAPGVPGIPADPSGLGGSGGTGVTDLELVDVVHVHRGVLGDTDPNGGPSDADATAHRWLNPVARVVVTVQ